MYFKGVYAFNSSVSFADSEISINAATNGGGKIY